VTGLCLDPSKAYSAPSDLLSGWPSGRKDGRAREVKEREMGNREWERDDGGWKRKGVEKEGREGGFLPWLKSHGYGFDC